jgi:hypothetical protein
MMMTLIPGGKQDARQMLEARGWIADCSSKIERKELTDEEVIQVVDRHYFGGWQQFGQDIESSFIAD